MTRYTTTDVLICGAGVTGLTLAIELARHGVSFRLIEKRTTPFIGSRGKGIQPRTQEIFEDLGILNKVVAAGGLYPRLRTYRHDGSYVDSDIAHHTKPTHAEPYHLPLMVPQNVTETIMREQLKAWDIGWSSAANYDILRKPHARSPRMLPGRLEKRSSSLII